MAYHIPEEEILDPTGLAQLQRKKLARMLDPVRSSNPFYGGRLTSTAFDALRDPIEHLPFTTRTEIQRDQLDHPPYGTNLTFGREHYVRLHQTSGSTGQPLRWQDTAESWDWWKKCWGIVFRAAGVTPDDRVFFPFSFGPFIGFWGGFEAAAALGNMVLPGGAMTSVARLIHLIENSATVVCCTPTYALRLAEVAAAEGIALAESPVRLVIVAGEPGGSIPATRQRIESSWNARVIDHAGMTEIGPWGFECVEAAGGIHVIESEFIAEVVDPKTGALLPDGQSGELVLTNLGRWGSPLIRYRTGDQVSLTRKRCACGRWFARAEGGILGRVDEMMVIRGNNVFPSAIEGLVREFSEVVEFSLVVEQSGALADLMVEVEACPGAESDTLCGSIEQALRNRFHFSVRVVSVDPGSLPRSELKSKRLIRRSSSIESTP